MYCLIVFMKKSVVSVEHPIVAKKINDSLNLSVREGSLSSVASGFGLSYFSPFALVMNATSTQVGILYAIINFLPSLVQLKTAKLLERFSRKNLVFFGVLGRILLWIPIILTGLLFYLGVLHVVWVFIGLISLFYVFYSISHPAWFSWMGSLVPEDKRGEYFSRRNRVTGFWGMLTMICGAIILDTSKKVGFYFGDVVGFTLLGFGLLFMFSGLIRIWALSLFEKHYEPRIKVRKRDHFSFWDFLSRGIGTSFGRFTLFTAVLNFVVAIAGPFWVVYMLRDLGFSYVWYMLVTVSSITFRLIFLPLLGKISDRFGNIRLIRICSWSIMMVPVLWILSVFIGDGLPLKFYLLLVPSIVNGFGWAGYNLAVNNYIYDAVRDSKRAFCLSYMNLIIGIGMFVGAGLGSLLAWINVSFMNPLLFIFAVSAVGRLLVAIFGLGFLKEVRHVHKFSPHYLVKEFGPARGIVREVHHLEHLVESVEHFK
jgi:MFS family permease